jgi:hypothetical protein
MLLPPLSAQKEKMRRGLRRAVLITRYELFLIPGNIPKEKKQIEKHFDLSCGSRKELHMESRCWEDNLLLLKNAFAGFGELD